MNILHIDDHDLFSAGLKAHMQQRMSEKNTEVHYLTVNNIEEAMPVIDSDPDRDIILLDLIFAKLDGLFLLKALRSRSCFIPVLIVSASEDLCLIKKALELGASGFLHKNSSPEIILKVIEQVAQGDMYVTVELAEKLRLMPDNLPQCQQQRARLSYKLSQRNYDVLELICLGLDNEQISSLLHISKNTLKTHIRSLFIELDVKSRGECIHVAIKKGLVEA